MHYLFILFIVIFFIIMTPTNGIQNMRGLGEVGGGLVNPGSGGGSPSGSFEIETENSSSTSVTLDEPVEKICLHAPHNEFYSNKPYCMADMRICLTFTIEYVGAPPPATTELGNITLDISHYTHSLQTITIPLNTSCFLPLTTSPATYDITIDFGGTNNIPSYCPLTPLTYVTTGTLFNSTDLYGDLIYGKWEIDIATVSSDPSIVITVKANCELIYPKKECCPKAVTASTTESNICLEKNDMLWIDFFFNRDCGKDLDCDTFHNSSEIQLYQILSPGVMSNVMINLGECYNNSNVNARTARCDPNSVGCTPSTNLLLEDSSIDLNTCNLMHFQCPFNGHFNSPYEYLQFAVFKEGVILGVTDVIKVKSDCSYSKDTPHSLNKGVTVERVFSDMTNLKFGDVVNVTNIVCNVGCACLKEICIYDSWCGIQGTDPSALSIPIVHYLDSGECVNYTCSTTYSYKHKIDSTYRINIDDTHGDSVKRGYIVENIDNMLLDTTYNSLKKTLQSRSPDNNNANKHEDNTLKIQKFYGYSIISAFTCVCDSPITNTSLPVNCSDNNPCTLDYFDTQIGCVNDPILDCCVVDSDCKMDHFLNPAASQCFTGSCVHDGGNPDHNRPSDTGCCHYVPIPPSQDDSFTCCQTDDDCNQIISYCDVYVCSPRGTCILDQKNHTACNDNNECTEDTCNDHGECENIPVPYCDVSYCGNGIVEEGEECEQTSNENEHIFNSCCTKQCTFKPFGALCKHTPVLAGDSYVEVEKLKTSCKSGIEYAHCTGKSSICPIDNSCEFEFTSIFIN